MLPILPSITYFHQSPTLNNEVIINMYKSHLFQKKKKELKFQCLME